MAIYQVNAYITTWYVSVSVEFLVATYRVCVLHVLSTRRHPAQPVSVPILEPKKRYKFCGHKATPQRYYVATYAVSTAVGNAKPCHHPGYDRHDIHIL